MDIIITKSISRFARNTVTLLETVRELKLLGVDVFFEKENLHSTSGDGELMLSILASFAQEESKSVSDNMKWRIQTNFKEGMQWNATLLGYRYENGVLMVVPTEAEIVRFIFESYLGGAGTQKIANELNAKCKITRKGCTWHKSSVMKILCNYTYTGNLILQTTYLSDHITKKPCKNNGELPKYHVEDAHEPIISMEQYLAVQAEINRRTEQYQRCNRQKTIYPFTGKLVCESCGKHYQRKKTATGYVWICSTFNREGKSACPSRQIPEKVLEQLSADVLKTVEFDVAQFEKQIEYIDICQDCIVKFHICDGRVETRTWQIRSRAESWTPDERGSEKKIMPKITVIPSIYNPETRMLNETVVKRRVAAYARVSTDYEEQITSYQAQVRFYTNYIKSRPDWQFVDVYTDEGISATSTKNRDGFNRMIADALAGHIDLIVTKSVSRFA